jgi:hypothetical protein
MIFYLKGKKVTQSGAVFPVALQMTADGWRAAAWVKARAQIA